MLTEYMMWASGQAPLASSLSWELYCPPGMQPPAPSVYLNHILRFSINEQHRHLGSCVQEIQGPPFPFTPPPSSQVIHHGFLCILHPRSLSYHFSSPPLTPHNAWPWPSLYSWGHHMTTLLPAPLSSLSRIY